MNLRVLLGFHFLRLLLLAGAAAWRLVHVVTCGSEDLDYQTAEQVEAIMRDVNRQLDDSVRLVMNRAGKEEFERFRRTIGKVMGEIFLEIQEPLYAQYPDLVPPGLRRS